MLMPVGTVTEGLCAADSLRALVLTDPGAELGALKTGTSLTASGGGGVGKGGSIGAPSDCAACVCAAAGAAVCGVCEVVV